MRRAGRKKEFAWFNTNTKLAKLSPAARSVLAGQYDQNDLITAQAQAYIDILATAGVDSGLGAADISGDWAANGIPREVWFGYTRLDTFSKPAGKDYYVGDHAAVIRQGAAELRAITTLYLDGLELSEDLVNSDPDKRKNPGGAARGSRKVVPLPA